MNDGANKKGKRSRQQIILLEKEGSLNDINVE